MSERAGHGEWTEPGAYEVVPGVYRIPLPLPNDGLAAVNVYALVSDEELVLVDSGWAIPAGRAALVAALAEINREPRDIDRFLITHAHRDHYTHAIELRREFGMGIALGSKERDFLDVAMQPSDDPLSPHIRALRMQGADDIATEIGARPDRQGESSREHLEYPDIWLGATTVAAAGVDLEVLPTPGHTQGHLCFADNARGLLFAGDHVLPTITPSIGFEPARAANPLGDFLVSLALIRARPDALLLPAHGPVASSTHVRVDELAAHHGRRLDDTEHAIGSGAETAYDAAKLLTWTRRERKFDELDLFNRMLAINETFAHLILLTEQGRISRIERDGVCYFTAG